MSMSNESAPPIRDLSDEIEAAMDTLWTAAIDDWSADACASAADDLRHAIRATLDDQDVALRERCERLRQGVLHASMLFPPDLLFGTNIRESDMDDDLIPRKQDVLDSA